MSSGSPPAAIAIVRISGPVAHDVLKRLTGRPLPFPRTAALRKLRHPGTGTIIDEALVLRFDANGSATGEPLVELHCHGGRAVVGAVKAAIGACPGTRTAEPGEFTRRAVLNGRMGLNEAEGLADLLEAETELARRDAVERAGGSLSRLVEGWRLRLLALSALAEAALDHSDEDDVGAFASGAGASDLDALIDEIATLIDRPTVERLRDGPRIVIAGPPNIGKSSLLNLLSGQDAAIVSDIAGTTRDRIEAPVAFNGIGCRLVDTAGLRDAHGDAVEAIGIDRAREAMATADLILWLGEEGGVAGAHCPVIEIANKCDLPGFTAKRQGISISASSSSGLTELMREITRHLELILPPPDGLTLSARLRPVAQALLGDLMAARGESDPLIAAELLRSARTAIDRLTGRSGVEDMLDQLYGRFCIGK